MKRLVTTLVSKNKNTIKKRVKNGVLLTLAVLLAVVAPLQLSQKRVYADEYDKQIAAIQALRDQYDSKAAALASQADTLTNKKAILENQEASIKQQIALTQAQYNQLQKQIADNEKKIEDNRNALGDTISNMYVDDTVSPLEMFASSSNISDYLDKQEYRSTISQNLTNTINDIQTLKTKLEQQKAEVSQLLSNQKSQEAQLTSKINEYNTLVADTKNQQSAYEKLSSEAAQKQDALRAQQQAAIAAALAASGNNSVVTGDASHGGYPNYLANAPQDSLIDPWGMYNRECVSYVAWKVHQKYTSGLRVTDMPYWGGRGNAKQWPSNAQSAGIGTGSTPKAGSAGVIYAGAWGHIVWVDSVNANGTVNISQYNYNWGSGRGLYSQMFNISPSVYDVYIYF